MVNAWSHPTVGASLDRRGHIAHNRGPGLEGNHAMAPPRIEIIVVTPFQQNCQLLWDPDAGTGIVVDPGGDVPRILQRIAVNGLAIEAILLTHGHLDHAGGAAELRAALPARPAGTPVLVIGPARRDAFLLSGIAAQAAALGIPGMNDVAPDRYLTEGEVLDLASCRLEVRHVPGHTPGHLVFIEAARRFGLVGDTLFKGSVGRTDFPYGDGPALLAGIGARLMVLDDDVAIIPGHGSCSTIGEERRTNPFL